jgi:hypothetical protein
MRYIRYIFDLPWWVGLPIFLFGNLLVPFGLFGYIIGLIISLFGCWTFSKLLKIDEYADATMAIVCIPLIAFIMWFVNERFIDPFIACSFGTLFVLRTVGGLFLGLIGFQGFRK